MHSTRDPGRDLHIPPGILYPSYENIVLLRFLHPFPSLGRLRTVHNHLQTRTPMHLCNRIYLLLSFVHMFLHYEMHLTLLAPLLVQWKDWGIEMASCVGSVAEHLLQSSLVDLGTGALGSSRYLSYCLMWLACVVSHLCRQHNPSGFRVFLSLKTSGHKSCILVRFLSIIST